MVTPNNGLHEQPRTNDPQLLNDVIIAGSGLVSGGKYNTVKISGSGKVNGDVEANQIKISGSGKINGNISTNDMKIAGSGSVKGNIHAGYFEVSGSAAIQGSVEGEVLKSSGSMKIDGNIQMIELENKGGCYIAQHVKVQKLVSRGSLKAGGDVEAEEFDSDGSFRIGGLLNVNRMVIRLQGSSYAKEMGGEEIDVRIYNFHKVNFFQKYILGVLFRKNKFSKLESELIEGTQISVENTVAKIIRGNHVKIGPKCQIELIEYSESLEIDPTSSVRKQMKI